MTLRQLREGASMSLQDVLTMEYRLSQACMVRAPSASFQPGLGQVCQGPFYIGYVQASQFIGFYVQYLLCAFVRL